jgi:hypothetical protein
MGTASRKGSKPKTSALQVDLSVCSPSHSATRHGVALVGSSAIRSAKGPGQSFFRGSPWGDHRPICPLLLGGPPAVSSLAAHANPLGPFPQWPPAWTDASAATIYSGNDIAKCSPVSRLGELHVVFNCLENMLSNASI